jgi:hypothetical protein
MSGRIPPNRKGFIGYACDGIAPIFLQCVDCTDNNYLRIPVNLGGVCSSLPWVNYYPAQTNLPDKWHHNCDLPYEGNFLEVEYPDVAPISVRGIGFKAGWTAGGEDINNCGYFKVISLGPTTLKVVDGNDILSTICGYALYIDQVIEVEALEVPVSGDICIWLEVNESEGTLYGNIQTGPCPDPEPNKFKLVISRVTFRDGVITYFTQEHCGWAIVDVLSIYSAVDGYKEGTAMGFTITDAGIYRWIEIKKCTPAEEVI